MIQKILKQVLENKYSKNEAEQKRLLEVLFLTQEYLNNYNLSAIEIKFTKRKDALGLCSSTGDTISLNLDFVMNDKLENIIETILHEIAHAMTSGEGHFIEWQIKAIELGLSYEHIQRYKEL
ncbi:MAG: hypothetical protein EOM47_00080 [Bacteroidia bacterium]|nr:hypothetical protein [Bacteroidia bacterium]